MSVDRTQLPTHVVSTSAVRWGIDALGSQKLHPTFVMYLYLRGQHRAGKLEAASASSEELLALIRMPGNSAKPYFFPLINRGDRTGSPLPSFWRSPNIPGSWSPGSLGRQTPANWLTSGSHYTLPDDHVERAFKHLLYEKKVSALALGAYFLRNDGLVLSDPNDGLVLSDEADITDLVAAFRFKFDYPADADDEFSQLFTTEGPTSASFAWFEPFGSAPDTPGQGG